MKIIKQISTNKSTLQPPKAPPKKQDKPSVITIQYDRLVFILHKFIAATKQGDWLAPLGIASSLLATLIVSDFKNWAGLSGEQWQAITIMALLASIIWLGYAIRASLKVPKLENLLTEIMENSEITREHRALFVLKVLSPDNLYRILVYRDILWDCYLMPHAKIKDEIIDQGDYTSLLSFIANTLALPAKSVQISYLDDGDLRSYKHSEFYRQDTTYVFNFFAVYISDVNQAKKLIKPNFEIAGKKFLWLTLDEMEGDSNTAKRNIDVTRHLRDYYNLFFVGIPDSFPYTDIVHGEGLEQPSDQPKPASSSEKTPE